MVCLSSSCSSSPIKFQTISIFCLRCPLDLSGAWTMIFFTNSLTIVGVNSRIPTYLRITAAKLKAYLDQKTDNWIKAHIQMFEFFGGVTPMLIPDNCSTAVNHSKSDWYTTALNATYHEMAEHYNIAIIPARVRKPKDKPNVEGSVGKISTWITAVLRNEQFFSLAELNAAIREKLDAYNARKL